MQSSHYETLGVSEKATKEEIKKAFHKLSLKYHPDRNPNNKEAYDMFQKINNAYEILEDDQKRREYDMGTFFQGEEGIDLNDILSSLFHGSGNATFGSSGATFGSAVNNNPFFQVNNSNPFVNPMFMGMGSLGGGVKVHVFGPGQQQFGMPSFTVPSFEQKPPAIQHDLMISLNQVYMGDKVPVEIERVINNHGLKEKEKEIIYINVPKGIDDGEIIVLKDKGHFLSENLKGDVKIFIKIESNTEFTRSGLDLIYQKTISLKEALCGFSFALKHLNGKVYTLSNGVGNIVTPNYKKQIPGMGLQREDHVGNLVIHFDVIFPKELSTETVTKLKELL